MSEVFLQQVLDRAVVIATDAALRGNPVRRLIWCGPATATQDPMGTFIIVPVESGDLMKV